MPDEIKHPLGFIYITTCLVNGKRYIGQKRFDDRWKKYLGSGHSLGIAVNKYGREYFHRDIILVCYSPEELNRAEYALSVFLNVVNSPHWYNEVYGGGACYGRQTSEELRAKFRAAKLGEKNPHYGVPAWNRGVSHTEEMKARIQRAQPHKPVLCVETGVTYFGAREAERQTGIRHNEISAVCRNIPKHYTAGGYHWKYTETETEADNNGA